MPALDESPDPAPVRPVSTPQSSHVPPTEARTPANKSPIAPSRHEMHPQFHHHTTAKPLDEARWLGFMNMGPQTEPPPKGLSKIPITQATPTKSKELANRTFSPPDFKFTFRHQELELSPQAKRMMEETRKDAARIRAQMAANPEQYGLQTTEDLQRKIAKPKPKATRFSEAHSKAFAKMDSIANHPSAFRADPNRFKPNAAGSLKRSPSKAELDTAEKNVPKMSRSRSNASLHSSDGKESAGPAKRVKRSKDDDASTARPASKDGSESAVAPRTGIPRLNHLSTPTKASLARSQSVKTLKKTTLIPDVSKSPSVQHPTTPSKAKSAVLEGIRKVGQTVSRLPTVKSILRTPARQYSDDPAKIAAGTHRPQPSVDKKLPAVPATEPVQKRVNFSDSTLARTEESKVVSPKAVNSGQVTYPDLSNTSPLRRATGDFTFRAEKTLKFGPSKPTIRHVRPSDASAAAGDSSTTRPPLALLRSKVDDLLTRFNITAPPQLSYILPPTGPTGLPTTSTPLDEFVTAVAARYSHDPATFVAVFLATLFAGALIGAFSFRRMSSWSNRFGAWSGRFSPFGRGDSANKEVSDADFSYITNEDLVASQKNLGAAPNSNSSSTDDLDGTAATRTRSRTNNHAHAGPAGRDNANGDTDVIVFKHKRVSYPIHFPRGAIDADSLSIFGMREAAARKMSIDDARRIKLFYKGRQLEDDRPAAAYGLRSDLESEIMCVVGEKASSSSGRRTENARSSNSYSDDEASSDDEDSYRSSTPGGGDGAAPSSSKSKKKRNRRGGRKTNKQGARATSAPQQPSSYVRGAAGSEYLGVPPSTALPPRPTSSSSFNRPSASPHRPTGNTAMDKLETLSSKYRTELEPLCNAFIAAPPADRAKRDFEYKKLTETVLAQVLLKLDAVDTSGDEEARARRKELVRECNAMLTRLDGVGKA
ncbi:hypothetical protein IWZ01DRAFT_425318 [Phyllosticta capitalensis]